MVTRCSRIAQLGTNVDTSSSSDSRPPSAASRTLMAVNALVIDASGKTVDWVIGTRRSRLAIPYPRSRTTAPLRLTPTPQPGESDPAHAVKTRSTRSAVDGIRGDAQLAARREPVPTRTAAARA